MIQVGVTSQASFKHKNMRKNIPLLTIILVSIVRLHGQCPKNMTAEGDNLIINGDFDLGNESFRSDYTFRRDFFVSNAVEAGEFSIQINPYHGNTNFAQCFGWNEKDNSMMVVNGNNKPNALIWSQKVTLEKGKTYNFGFWLSSIRDIGSSSISIDVMIGEKIVGSLEHTQIGTCNWKEYNFHWKSTKAGVQELKIVSQYEGGERGNDFAIDDLILYACYEQTKEEVLAFLDDIVTLADKPVVLAQNDQTTTTEGTDEKVDIAEQVAQHVKGKLKTVTLDNVFFESGKSTLKTSSFEELDKLASLMNTTFKEIKIEISGHTDNVGTEASNLALSRNRARSVMNYLLKKKVAYARMKSKGYGSTQAIATNDTEEGRQTNRRVEFKIIY